MCGKERNIPVWATPLHDRIPCVYECIERLVPNQIGKLATFLNFLLTPPPVHLV